MVDPAWERVIASLPPLESREFNVISSQAAKQAGAESVTPASLALRACNTTPQDPGEGPFFGCRTSVEAGIKEYHAKQYGGGKAVNVKYQFDKNEAGHLVLRTYAEMIDTHKSRTGCWSGCWTIDNDCKLRGTISAHVYNSEDGNMQFRAKREVPEKKISNADDVVKAIKRAEASLLSDLTDQEALTSSLKRIRRILPITKTRMKWDDAAHKGVGLLNERSAGK